MSGKAIAPFALQSALDARKAKGEDVTGWVGLPEGVRQSLIKMDSSTGLLQMTAESSVHDAVEQSGLVKRVDMGKDVQSQDASSADLEKFGASPVDDAMTAIRKACASVSSEFELYFDKQIVVNKLESVPVK